MTVKQKEHYDSPDAEVVEVKVDSVFLILSDVQEVQTEDYIFGGLDG